MVSTYSSCRLNIMIALALLVLLLPAAIASDSEPPSQLPVPVLYESCYWYGPPNITAKPPKKKNKYVVNVMSFEQTFDVEPVSFNLTANIDKRLPEGRAVIQLIPANNGEWSTRNVDLCSLTTSGCPIHHGNFTVSFDLILHGFYQVQFSMFAKNGELLTCVLFEGHGPFTVPDGPTPAPSDAYETTPAPSEPYEPTPAPSEHYEPTLPPSEHYEPTPGPSESYKLTPTPSEPYEPTPAPSEPYEPTPAPSKASDSEPPSQSQLPPVWIEDCGFFGPPNITANPPENITYNVLMKSFYMTSDAQPHSYDVTYAIDKILPGGRAVTQIMPAMTGKTTTLNEDLCGYVRGGCPVLPGDFVVSFNLAVDYFTEYQFSMFTEAGELLQCVYFEAS